MGARGHGHRRQRSRARRGEGERLRTDIMRATHRLLLRTKDADAVSVRAVADACGVTPPSIYMHFAHKEDLILAVCQRQFEEFDAEMAKATDGIDDPVEALKAMGRAYVRFGLDHPEQYRFLFMSKTPKWVVEQRRTEELTGFARLVECVSRCIDSGAFAPADPFGVACGLWAAVHGVTSLLIANPHFPWPPVDDLVAQGIDVHCRGLKTS